MKTLLKSLIGLFSLVLFTNVALAQTADKPLAGATYTYRVQAEDIDNTIKAWLPNIEIISPLSYRDKFIKELENYLSLYKK